MCRGFDYPRVRIVAPSVVSTSFSDHSGWMKFDRDTITAELAAKQCKSCGHIGAGMTFAFLEGPHFARLDCNGCGAFIEWVSMPDAPKRERRKTRRKLEHLGDRCEICLRHRDELPAPEQLEVHHVLEVAADAGSDEDANLRVYCTACHSIVGWLRTYFGHYAASTGTSNVETIDAG